VSKLATAGSTALGPALATAIGIAGQFKQSEVFVCTDGQANCGIGSTESSTARGLVQSCYRGLGELAQAQNTIISVIGIEGEAVAMDNLSICADLTQGSVNIVRPLELRREMRTQAQKRIIGREVVAKLFLPAPFVLKNPVAADSESVPLFHSVIVSADLPLKDQKLQQNGAIIVRNFKSVTDDTELTLEFGVLAQDAAKFVINPSVPAVFQAQITYTKPNGSRCMRTITKALDSNNLFFKIFYKILNKKNKIK